MSNAAPRVPTSEHPQLPDVDAPGQSETPRPSRSPLLGFLSGIRKEAWQRKLEVSINTLLTGIIWRPREDSNLRPSA